MRTEREQLLRVLQEIGLAEASDTPLDPVALASEIDVDRAALEFPLEAAEAAGLALFGTLEESPILTRAGRQYLAREGEVSRDILRFLPRVVDDLNAREALILAGSILVDEFRYQVLAGRAIEHARELVPPAFAVAVDEKLALNLYSASVALMARISGNEPAACVGEEVIAVNLLDGASVQLDLFKDVRGLSAEDRDAAERELRSVFDLLGDDDVLLTFEMEEPSDASVAEHDPIAQQLGVVDQRIESWFKPFGTAIDTGYLLD